MLGVGRDPPCNRKKTQFLILLLQYIHEQTKKPINTIYFLHINNKSTDNGWLKMQDHMSKEVKCPHCDTSIQIEGLPGEQKILVCPNCGLKGQFTFPSTSSEIKKTAMGISSTVIEVKNLTKKYKDVLAVDNISFTVKRGEIFGFLGPNGAGKTTTIRTLLGFLKPTAGQAFVMGESITDDIVKIRKNVGYIPGELALYEHLTGDQFLEYFRSIRNTDPTLLSDLLDIFDLPLNRKIKGYSKGMKQKMGIIQAFMDDPEIVIMDEPTSGLDPLLQQKFYEFLRRERSKGRTIFFSSHILSEVDRICDRVGIIRNGKMVALEDIDTLKHKTGKKIRLRIKEDPSELLKDGQAKMNNGWIEITIHNTIDIWIKKLAAYTVLDLEIKEFNLEDYFMRYYVEKKEAV